MEGGKTWRMDCGWRRGECYVVNRGALRGRIVAANTEPTENMAKKLMFSGAYFNISEMLSFLQSYGFSELAATRVNEAVFGGL